jgi:hypothetical protein
VNAKSMWRRHVFEKHKVAMSNRRDSNDRTRGRAATSECKTFYILGVTDCLEENRHQRPSTSSKENTETEYKTVNLDTLWGNPSFPHKSHDRKSRSLAAIDGPCAKAALAARVELSRAAPPTSPNESSSGNTSQLQHSSTPGMRRLSVQSHGSQGDQPVQAQNASPVVESRYATVPESPYDPLRTPAFRHSPARLPLDQPWRFPSPSHPLHSDAWDLNLGTVAQNIMSPNPRDIISPLQFAVISPKLFSPSRTMFSKGEQLSPQTISTTQIDDPEDSPFIDRSSPNLGTSNLNDWVSRALLAPSDSVFVDTGLLVDTTSKELLDPFPWTESLTDSGEAFSPASSPEIESPVLRSTRFPELSSSDGMGFGQDSGLRIWKDEDLSIDPMLPTWIGDFDDLELDYSFETSKRPYDGSPMRKRRRTYSDHSAASGSD